MGMHHPRSSYRISCRACLSIKHYRKDCKFSNPVQSAASFTTDATVTQVGAPVLLAAPLFDAKQLESLRERLAPELPQHLRDQKTALSQEEARRQSNTIAREAVCAARPCDVEVQKKRADIEQKRQHAE